MPLFRIFVKNISDPVNQTPSMGTVWEEVGEAPTEEHARSYMESIISKTGSDWREHYELRIYPEN